MYGYTSHTHHTSQVSSRSIIQSEQSYRSEHSHWSGESCRSKVSNRSERSDRSNRMKSSNRSGHSEQIEQSNQSDLSQQPKQPDQPEQNEQSNPPGPPGQFQESNQTKRPDPSAGCIRGSPHPSEQPTPTQPGQSEQSRQRDQSKPSDPHHGSNGPKGADHKGTVKGREQRVNIQTHSGQHDAVRRRDDSNGSKDHKTHGKSRYDRNWYNATDNRYQWESSGPEASDPKKESWNYRGQKSNEQEASSYHRKNWSSSGQRSRGPEEAPYPKKENWNYRGQRSSEQGASSYPKENLNYRGQRSSEQGASSYPKENWKSSGDGYHPRDWRPDEEPYTKKQVLRYGAEGGDNVDKTPSGGFTGEHQRQHKMGSSGGWVGRRFDHTATCHPIDHGNHNWGPTHEVSRVNRDDPYYADTDTSHNQKASHAGYRQDYRAEYHRDHKGQSNQGSYTSHGIPYSKGFGEDYHTNHQVPPSYDSEPPFYGDYSHPASRSLTANPNPDFLDKEKLRRHPNHDILYACKSKEASFVPLSGAANSGGDLLCSQQPTQSYAPEPLCGNGYGSHYGSSDDSRPVLTTLGDQMTTNNGYAMQSDMSWSDYERLQGYM